jgi:hypothetical protein
MGQLNALRPIHSSISSDLKWYGHHTIHTRWIMLRADADAVKLRPLLDASEGARADRFRVDGRLRRLYRSPRASARDVEPAC